LIKIEGTIENNKSNDHTNVAMLKIAKQEVMESFQQTTILSPGNTPNSTQHSINSMANTGSTPPVIKTNEASVAKQFEQLSSGTILSNSTTLQDDCESEEDLSDEAFALRHYKMELRERTRYEKPYPNGVMPEYLFLKSNLKHSYDSEPANHRLPLDAWDTFKEKEETKHEENITAPEPNGMLKLTQTCEPQKSTRDIEMFDSNYSESKRHDPQPPKKEPPKLRKSTRKRKRSILNYKVYESDEDNLSEEQLDHSNNVKKNFTSKSQNNTATPKPPGYWENFCWEVIPKTPPINPKTKQQRNIVFLRRTPKKSKKKDSHLEEIPILSFFDNSKSLPNYQKRTKAWFQICCMANCVRNRSEFLKHLLELRRMKNASTTSFTKTSTILKRVKNCSNKDRPRLRISLQMNTVLCKH